MAARCIVRTAIDPDRLAAMAASLVQGALRELPVADLRGLPVLVPSLPMRDRLRGALASRLGICAGLDLLLPAEFIQRWLPDRLGLLAGMGRWDATAARWRVTSLLGDVPQLGLAATWDARRLALGSRVLDALTRCGLWAAQETTAAWKAGQPGAWDEDLPWLPGLWRSLIADERIGDPQDRIDDLVAGLRRADDLPPLVLAWQTNALAPPVMTVLNALARHVPVVVLLLQPSDAEVSDHRRRRRAAAAGEDDPRQWNRLLAEWGAEHRMVVDRLAEAGADVRMPEADRPAPATLLQRVQDDLAAGRGPSEVPAFVRAADDDSIAFIHAYGLRSQVEAVKRALARSLNASDAPPLHDICIACPDPAALAPLLAAIFAGTGDGPPMPVDLRGTAGGDPALTMAARLLDLLPGRWPAPDVLDCCASPAAVQGHGLSVDDLRRLRAWCETADLRFGVDAAHRDALGLGAFAAGSWRRGLARLALGALLGADTDRVWPAGTGRSEDDLPAVAGLDEDDVAALRRWTGLLLPMLDAASDWRRPQTPAWWAEHVPAMVRHVRGSGDGDALDSGLASVLGRWASTLAGLGLGSVPISAEAVAVVLAESDPAGRGQGVRRGGIAVGTPATLRGFPWRITCLVGFDDGTYPRQTVSDVDLLARHRPERVGDPRSEDRGALLDLLVSTRDRLLVSWTGHEPRRGQAVPPATVIADLQQVIAETCGMPDADGAATCLAAMTTDAGIIGAYAAAGDAAAGRPWPSTALRDAATALAKVERDSGLSLVPATAINAPPATVIQLDDVLRFWRDPAAAWLRRMQVAAHGPWAEDEDPDGHERFDLGDALATYALRAELAAGTADAEDAVIGWQRTGAAPAGALGRRQAARVIGPAMALRAASTADRAARLPHGTAIDLDLGGHRLVGHLDAVVPGIGPLVLHPGTASAAMRQRTWILGLAHQAAGGQGGGRIWHLAAKTAKPVDLPAVPAATALAALAGVVAGLAAGLTQPCALLPDLVEAWLRAELDDEDGRAACRALWWRDATEHHRPLRHRPACRMIWPEPADPFADDTGIDLAVMMRASGVAQWSPHADKVAQAASEDG